MIERSRMPIAQSFKNVNGKRLTHHMKAAQAAIKGSGPATRKRPNAQLPRACRRMIRAGVKPGLFFSMSGI